VLDVGQLHLERQLLNSLLANGVFAPLLFEHLTELADIVGGDAAENLALFRVDQLGDGFVGRLAEYFTGFQASTRAGDDLLTARMGIAAPGIEHSQVAHHTVADNILWHSTTGSRPDWRHSSCRIERDSGLPQVYRDIKNADR
jgi:hypothetical protein